MSNKKDKCLDEITKPCVDNSEQPCAEYIDACCVILGTNQPFLNIKAGDSLEVVLNTLITTIKKQQQTIENLQNYVQTLE